MHSCLGQICPRLELGAFGNSWEGPEESRRRPARLRAIPAISPPPELPDQIHPMRGQRINHPPASVEHPDLLRGDLALLVLVT
jgi:hypothetical protein